MEFFCDLQDPRDVINALKLLNHLNMYEQVQKISSKYLERFKVKSSLEYLKFIQDSKLLTLDTKYENDFALLYLVKSCLNISELSSRQVLL